MQREAYMKRESYSIRGSDDNFQRDVGKFVTMDLRMISLILSRAQTVFFSTHFHVDIY